MKTRLKIFSFYCCVFITQIGFSQNQANHWAFGDSVGIDFNTSPPSIDTTIIIASDEPSASISDNNGNLLFYVGAAGTNFATSASFKYVVRNSIDSIMQNGDSLAGNTSVTQGLLILNDPGDSLKFYIFHSEYQFHYSIVDISANGGLGNVVSFNNYLEDSLNEKMHAVKASNGRDWWVLKQNAYINNFVRYKLDSSGIHGPHIQTFGINSSYGGSGQMIFSQQGDKLLFTGAGSGGYSTITDFNRCTGLISNEIILDTYNINGNSSGRYGCSFSSTGHYAYLSAFDSLWQFDLTATNIAASKTFIWKTGNNQRIMGQHMLAPDGKIYIANEKVDRTYDSLCTYLSVINDPDSPGLSCNFAPYSFSLNNRTSTGSLPNMPNFNLGVLENVNCDSILAGVQEPEKKYGLRLYPNPGNGLFHFEVTEKIKIQSIEIINLTGALVFVGKHTAIDLTNFPSGIYFYRVLDQKQHWYYGKIIKE
ncbi:hypothetical protein BH11BAC2_BH11BAC2_25350 [soil metagenome]